ncbi:MULTISPECIES: hypothetical protein [Bacillus]|uniref:hypothetical protein n=1 Tax=Bacillus TaxID=1386 RepID=UPI00093311FF|nr:hypothetical protein [Bacillus subtilis]MCY8984356.1 hypothetical protein [Bacillus subtilis]MDR4183398.1 hypothetical protein [Bacillus subtilis]QAV88387.1 hypothetical protein ES963_09640 [Bacillus subtilis]RXM08398.1 hypothetical protein ETL41_01060 [Bacillus subtilis]RXM12363.1 hypothetical protein ETL41_22575 [Bacillus subtilis]
MNLEHPIITEINRYGYPLEYLKYEDNEDQNDENVDNSVKNTFCTGNPSCNELFCTAKQHTLGDIFTGGLRNRIYI